MATGRATGRRHTESRVLPGTRRRASGRLLHRIADDGFFVHKSPGLRLRLRTDLARAAELDRLLTDTLDGFTRRQLIEGWYPSVYEPERSLFGGPVSMRSVHRVFTADSLAWTGFHGLAAPAGPVWAMSLLMLGSLLSALDIVGWEDRNVWDHLRVNAGRVVSDQARRAAAMSRLAAVLRHHWDNPDATRARLSEPAQALAEEYAQAVRAEAPRWIGEYFRAPGAWLGPRAVAAHTIVFHWNRAALPAHHQALLVAALAVPPGHDSITGGQS